VIFGYCVGDWACTAGSAFTARSTFNHNLIEDMVAGSAGTYAATGSANNGWTMQMVALRPAARFVQGVANAASGSASSLSLSFTTNTKAGDLILVAFDYPATSTVMCGRDCGRRSRSSQPFTTNRNRCRHAQTGACKGMSTSVDGRAERWWNYESGFVYRTSRLDWSGGTQNG
jgi:hypothetical protein